MEIEIKEFQEYDDDRKFRKYQDLKLYQKQELHVSERLLY